MDRLEWCARTHTHAHTHAHTHTYTNIIWSTYVLLPTRTCWDERWLQFVQGPECEVEEKLQ